MNFDLLSGKQFVFDSTSKEEELYLVDTSVDQTIKVMAWFAEHRNAWLGEAELRTIPFLYCLLCAGNHEHLVASSHLALLTYIAFEGCFSIRPEIEGFEGSVEDFLAKSDEISFPCKAGVQDGAIKTLCDQMEWDAVAVGSWLQESAVELLHA